jgi:hypothetical protein
MASSQSNDIDEPVSGWVGWIFFAAIFMMINGAFEIIQGLAAILKDKSYFVAGDNGAVVFNLRTWGWIHLVFGIILVVVGLYLMRGVTWARVAAVVVVAINMIGQFSFLGAYPGWSIVALAIDAFILYAIIVHGREARPD